MIAVDRPDRPATVLPIEKEARKPWRTGRRRAGAMHSLVGFCLLLACLGSSWFAYQYSLVPQAKSFAPDWHGAQWIQANDGNAPTAYFRYATTLHTLPDNAFVEIAASQVFNLYVNGTLIGSSDTDINNYPRAYMYDISSSLVPGANVIAIRVDNLDSKLPFLRATIITSSGGVITYDETGAEWQATAQADLVYPQDTAFSQEMKAWTEQTFDAQQWPPARPAAQVSLSPLLLVNPLLYEQPFTTTWIAGSNAQDAYFSRQITLAGDFSTVWLRIAATGMTDVFINGYQVIALSEQPISIRQIVIRHGKPSEGYRYALSLGAYDVSSYLHPGVNTIAVHVLSPQAAETIKLPANPPPLEAEAALDLLTSDAQGHMRWLTLADGWNVARAAVPGWTTGGGAASAWTPAVPTGLPQGYDLIYLSQSNLLTSGQQVSQIIPAALILALILCCCAGVLLSWLLMSLFAARFLSRPRRFALETMSLAFLPALAIEGLLLALAKEPQIARPFPYTRFWGLLLLALVGVGYGLLWLHMRRGSIKRQTGGHKLLDSRLHLIPDGRPQGSPPRPTSTPAPTIQQGSSIITFRVLSWLKSHWGLVAILLVTMPMVCYNLGYESFWQDELDSYNVAQSITHTGLSFLPSGFYYPKAELYSYTLAFVMKVFGDQVGTLRMVSAVEYGLTVILLYYVGCYFFDRRVAILATVLLAFSTQELLWARQVRMYQQAELLTLLTLFLFYRALQERKRARRCYLAVGALLVTYLSHEETFIVLPGLVICVLLVSWIERKKGHRLPEILYNKHWWFAAGIGVSIIALQLLTVQLTHPPMLGTDLTTRPDVQLTTDNISYYFNIFFQSPDYPWLNTVLALLGSFWAMRSKNLRLQYIALFLIIGTLTLVFVFTMQSDRYFYPLSTFYFLMDAYALVKTLRAIWNFARTRRAHQRTAHTRPSLPLKLLMTLIAGPLCLSVLIAPMLPLISYNLLVSRVSGLPYYYHETNYAGTAQFMRQHLRKGDIVISVVADPLVLYYVGQSDYFFSIDRALFLLEQNGHIVDTYTGKIALINQADFNAVLSSHTRVWLISEGYKSQNELEKHFIIPADFHIVYTEYGIAVYLRGG
jgi:4-amino-4-deoxy-L-arabinose transferase-like glycosyltransferase